MFCVHFIDHEIDQRHRQTDRQDRRGQERTDVTIERSDSIGRTVLQTVAQKFGFKNATDGGLTQLTAMPGAPDPLDRGA